MKPRNQIFVSVEACRFCRYFDPIGRRGGDCEKLQAHVEADWVSCALAMPAFQSYLESESPRHVRSPLLNPSLTPALTRRGDTSIPNPFPTPIPNRSPLNEQELRI
jgi:hypothetical protein